MCCTGTKKLLSSPIREHFLKPSFQYFSGLFFSARAEQTVSSIFFSFRSISIDSFGPLSPFFSDFLFFRNATRAKAVGPSISSFWRRLMLDTQVWSCVVTVKLSNQMLDTQVWSSVVTVKLSNQMLDTQVWSSVGPLRSLSVGYRLQMEKRIFDQEKSW